MPANESSVTSTILQKIKKFPAFPPYHLTHCSWNIAPGFITRASQHLQFADSPYYDRAYFPEIPSHIPLFMVFYGKRQIMYSGMKEFVMTNASSLIELIEQQGLADSGVLM
jgi:hypothetical protein